jgi:GT2 family glycosyltransferase
MQLGAVESTPTIPTPLEQVGAVVIGRNEGERLIGGLTALLSMGLTRIVYVDSGSTDDSCEWARQHQIQVIELDVTLPFTAARARNAGYQYLVQHHPDLRYLQFIDGDCELITGWLETAITVLDQRHDVVAVCGWTKERYPERSIYNQICDLEWHASPVGEVASFGGIVMIRVQGLIAVSGFNPNIIAGEEPELCIRLRQAGWKILRLDVDMTLHDAAMYRFGQWWLRAKRGGYAYAQVAALHGGPPEYGFARELQRVWLWGAIMPILTIALLLPTKGLSALLLGRYPWSVLRVAVQLRQQHINWFQGLVWGLSCAIAPFPQFLGVVHYYLTCWQQRQHQIIEYKN